MEENIVDRLNREDEQPKKCKTVAVPLLTNCKNLAQVCQDRSMREEETLCVVKALLDAGANPNFRWEEGNTCLHYAAMHSTPGVVRVLIDAGARVNVRNVSNYTPLAEACKREDFQIVLLLVNATITQQRYDGVDDAVLHACRTLSMSFLKELERINCFGDTVVTSAYQDVVVGRSTCLMLASCNRLGGDGPVSLGQS